MALNGCHWVHHLGTALILSAPTRSIPTFRETPPARNLNREQHFVLTKTPTHLPSHQPIDLGSAQYIRRHTGNFGSPQASAQLGQLLPLISGHSNWAPETKAQTLSWSNNAVSPTTSCAERTPFSSADPLPLTSIAQGSPLPTRGLSHPGAHTTSQ